MKRAIILTAVAVAIAFGAAVTALTVSPQTARAIILTAVTVAIAFGTGVTVLTVMPETAVACDNNNC
jgi:hypothetical protein